MSCIIIEVIIVALQSESKRYFLVPLAIFEKHLVFLQEKCEKMENRLKNCPIKVFLAKPHKKTPLKTCE